MKDTLLYKNVKRIPETFDNEEVERIIQEIIKSKNYWKFNGNKEWGQFYKMRDSCIIMTIILTGVRPKEACCIKFSDINTRNMTLRIDGSANKTRKSRIIPLPSKLMVFYNEYLKFPRTRFWKGSIYLFPTYYSNHISPGTLKAIMREKALKPAGLWHCQRESKAQYRTLYRLRHTFASNLLNKQIENNGNPDLYAIANILGHSTLASTQVYLHTSKDYMKYLKEQMEL